MKTQTKNFDVKIYTENTFGGTGSHRALADFRDCEGADEKDAALKMLALYKKNHKGGYEPKVVECGGCRRTPGAGRVYFFEGEDPTLNYEKNSRGQLLAA